MVMIGDPRAETRGTGKWWRELSAEDRFGFMVDAIGDKNVRVVGCSAVGRVLIELPDGPTGITSEWIRHIERKARTLDDGIRIFRKQKPDQNALRRLRGVVVNED